VRLKDKVAIVTGAGGGLGAATARLFAAEGANLVLTDVNLDGLTRTRQSIQSNAAITVEHDVADQAAWQEVLARTVENYGKLDVLVNNAGVYLVKSLADTTLEDFERLIGVNQTGCFLGMKLASEIMLAGASIINISSADGIKGRSHSAAYCATKFAVRGMTKAVALELVDRGIRVNSVHPGGIKTEMLPPEANPVGAVPMNRFAEPEEIAQVIVFLASDESSYCTGSEFVTDGGIIC
jgi:3alpha(or 20beta)-hydroxysteroid dehydrogenase